MSCGLVAVDTSVHETNAARIGSAVLSAQVVVPKVLRSVRDFARKEWPFGQCG